MKYWTFCIDHLSASSIYKNYRLLKMVQFLAIPVQASVFCSTCNSLVINTANIWSTKLFIAGAVSWLIAVKHAVLSGVLCVMLVILWNYCFSSMLLSCRFSLMPSFIMVHFTEGKQWCAVSVMNSGLKYLTKLEQSAVLITSLLVEYKHFTLLCSDDL